MTWIGAAPRAGGLVHQVALNRIRAAASEYPGRLVWYLLCGENDLGFERYFMPCMFAVLDLIDLPCSQDHCQLQISSKVYKEITLVRQ